MAESIDSFFSKKLNHFSYESMGSTSDSANVIREYVKQRKEGELRSNDGQRMIVSGLMKDFESAIKRNDIDRLIEIPRRGCR